MICVVLRFVSEKKESQVLTRALSMNTDKERDPRSCSVQIQAVSRLWNNSGDCLGCRRCC